MYERKVMWCAWFGNLCQINERHFKYRVELTFNTSSRRANGGIERDVVQRTRDRIRFGGLLSVCRVREDWV